MGIHNIQELTGNENVNTPVIQLLNYDDCKGICLITGGECRSIRFSDYPEEELVLLLRHLRSYIDEVKE